MAAEGLAQSAPNPRHRTYWRDVWLRLRRNRLAMASLAYVVALVLVALSAPYIQRYDPIVQDLDNAKKPPSMEHFFGTDLYGRDIYSRVVHGTRIALIVGIIATAVAIVLGVMLGGISGYFGGFIDQLVIFVYSVVATFPSLLFILALTNALPPVGEPRLFKVYLAIGLSSWVGMCRLTRNLFRSFREQEYVLAARALGAGPLRIIFMHMVPNMTGFIVVAISGGIAGAIAAEAGISFLGFGVAPPDPSWGVMVSEGRSYLQANWWMIVCPAMATLLAVFAFNLLADGLRDAFDPRHENV